jgi:hypothetical protein
VDAGTALASGSLCWCWVLVAADGGLPAVTPAAVLLAPVARGSDSTVPWLLPAVTSCVRAWSVRQGRACVHCAPVGWQQPAINCGPHSRTSSPAPKQCRTCAASGLTKIQRPRYGAHIGGARHGLFHTTPPDSPTQTASSPGASHARSAAWHHVACAQGPDTRHVRECLELLRWGTVCIRCHVSSTAQLLV